MHKIGGTAQRGRDGDKGAFSDESMSSMPDEARNESPIDDSATGYRGLPQPDDQDDPTGGAAGDGAPAEDGDAGPDQPVASGEPQAKETASRQAHDSGEAVSGEPADQLAKASEAHPDSPATGSRARRSTTGYGDDAAPGSESADAPLDMPGPEEGGDRAQVNTRGAREKRNLAPFFVALAPLGISISEIVWLYFSANCGLFGRDAMQGASLVAVAVVATACFLAYKAACILYSGYMDKDGRR